MWTFNKSIKPLTFSDLSEEERNKAYARFASFGDGVEIKLRYDVHKLATQINDLTKELEMYKAFVGKINPSRDM